MVLLYLVDFKFLRHKNKLLFTVIPTLQIFYAYMYARNDIPVSLAFIATADAERNSFGLFYYVVAASSTAGGTTVVFEEQMTKLAR